MKRIAFAVLIVFAALVGGLAVAYAAIPDSGTGVITGCYKNNGGDLRVIDAQAGATCPGGYTQLTWNQTGPAGPPGLSGLEEVIITLPFTSLQPDGETEGNAICPGGKVAISGGFDNVGALKVRAFFRRSQGDGWYLLVRNETASPVNVFARVRALCAAVG